MVYQAQGDKIVEKKVKLMEKEINNLKTMLEKKTLICSRAFHDIRGYFGIIGGNIKFIEQISQDKEVKSIAESAMGALDELTYLIQDFSDLNKFDSQGYIDNFEEYCIEDIVNAATTMFNQQLHNSKIEVEIYKDFLPIKINFRLMCHVIRNLLVNSANRASKNCLIKIKAVPHISTTGQKEIAITVSDSGPEISSGFLERPIFQFCSQVMNFHKGRFEFHYSNKECRFTLFLPTAL